MSSSAPLRQHNGLRMHVPEAGEVSVVMCHGFPELCIVGASDARRWRAPVCADRARPAGYGDTAVPSRSRPIPSARSSPICRMLDAMGMKNA